MTATTIPSIPSITLNDGHSIPGIGFGTWPMRGAAATAATLGAIEAGYRLIDTAWKYENEDAIGEAARRSGLRDRLTITTKVWGDRLGHEETLESFAESSANLGLDRVDLFLIHWPDAGDGYRESWRALIDLRDRGLVRSIGVSNFGREHLERIIADTGVVPAVNQVRLHPHSPQAELREFHEESGIVTESFSPLGLSPLDPIDVLGEPVVVEIARAHGISTAQAVLRWHVQIGAVPIPKSGDPVRQRENLDLTGFELEPAEIDAISALARS